MSRRSRSGSDLCPLPPDRAASRHVKKNERITCGDRQECAGGPRRDATSLFPILERPDGDAKQPGKVRLREPCPFANRRNAGDMDHPPILPTLQLAEAFENLAPDVPPR
jgi:hypothetical protein